MNASTGWPAPGTAGRASGLNDHHVSGAGSAAPASPPTSTRTSAVGPQSRARMVAPRGEAAGGQVDSNSLAAPAAASTRDRKPGFCLETGSLLPRPARNRVSRQKPGFSARRRDMLAAPPEGGPMDQPGRLTRAAWSVVGLLWVVALLNYLDRQLVVTMGGPIKADLRIDNERFGLFPAVFLWVYGLCSPAAGYLA